MGMLLQWLIIAAAVTVGSRILPGISVDSWTTTFIVAAVIGVINALLRPVLVIITLPLTIITLGIFFLILNGALVLLADYLVPGFEVDSLWSGVLFSILLALFGWLAGKFK